MWLGAEASSLPGRSAFEIDASFPRPRTYTFHSWTNANGREPYYDALLLFDVKGRVALPQSWSFQRAILDPTADLEGALADLEIGLSAVLDMGDGPFRSAEPYA